MVDAAHSKTARRECGRDDAGATPDIDGSSPGSASGQRIQEWSDHLLLIGAEHRRQRFVIEVGGRVVELAV
jgi:hypothetical protein